MTTSIYIPRILKHVTQSNIKQIFYDNSIGMATRVDLLKVYNDANEWIHNKAFIHLEYWYVNNTANELKEAINTNNGNNKLFYDNKHYWILLLNSSENVPPEEQNDTIMSVYYVPTDHEPTPTSLACPTTIPVVDHYMDPPENADAIYFTYYTAEDYAIETANNIKNSKAIEDILSTCNLNSDLENDDIVDELLDNPEFSIPKPDKITRQNTSTIINDNSAAYIPIPLQKLTNITNIFNSIIDKPVL